MKTPLKKLLTVKVHFLCFVFSCVLLSGVALAAIALAEEIDSFAEQGFQQTLIPLPASLRPGPDI